MDINERRRSALRLIIKNQFGDVVADFARRVERSPAQVWQFMSGDRPIGEKLARGLEEKLGIPPGALDAEETAAEPDVLDLRPDEAEAIRRLRRSGGYWRAFVLGLVKLEPLAQDALVRVLRQVALPHNVENPLQQSGGQLVQGTQAPPGGEAEVNIPLSPSSKDHSHRK